MSVNVCLDDIFWVTEHFVTKFGMMVHHHEPECHVEFCVHVWLSSRSRSQRALIWPKYDSYYYIFWTVDSLATKLGLMMHHYKPECPVKKIGLLLSGSRSQRRVKMLMFVQRISSEPLNSLFSNLVLWFIVMSQSDMLWVRVTCKKIDLLFSRSKSLQELIMIKIWQFLLYLLNCWSFCYHTWFNSTLS